MSTTTIDQLQLQEMLTAQRPRLLGLCAYLTNDPDSAEDVVQEVLLEAWRSVEKLRDPTAVDAWLNGIVRNVCARWQRMRGRDTALMVSYETEKAEINSALDNVPADFDLEVALDRQELALLLDRALALLPETTRDVLVSKYIAESRHAEIANQLGLSENAVTVRLHRGKVALRKLLTTELRAEAETFGLVTPTDEWVTTRLWCPQCGQQRMMGRVTATQFTLRCPICSVEPDDHLANEDWHEHESPLGQMKSFRPALKRLATRWFDLYTAATSQGAYFCSSCQLWSPVRLYLPDTVAPSLYQFRGVDATCLRCGVGGTTSLHLMALSSPAGLRFYQTHPRIRTLPDREIEFEGVPAILLSFASVTDSATFDVIAHRKTYAILTSFRSDE